MLAAGQSSRMGSVKALLDAGGGRVLVQAACESLAAVGLAPVLVVVGHHAAAVRGAVGTLGLPVENPHPDLGQVSSMAVGLAAAAARGFSWALVALVDQPPVLAGTLALLAAAARAEPMAVHVPTWRGRRGHPSVLPTSLAPALGAAGRDEGARDVIARLGLPVREHAVEDASVLVDLDTPEDVARWRAGAEGPHPSPVPRGSAPAAPQSDAEFLAEAARRSAAREPFALCTVVSTDRSVPREAGAKMLVAPDGSITGTVGGGPLEASVIFEATRLLRDQGSSTLLQFALSAAGDRAALLPSLRSPDALDEAALALGMKCGGAVAVFLDLVRPPARLLIYGAGHVGERVAAIAAEAGWHTVVIDDRAAFVTRDRLPRASELRCADLGTEPLGGVSPASEDFIVIVTRCHELDEGVLEAALGSRARYVGLIGSRRKVALILNSIERRTGRDGRRDPRLHAPIGLLLGDKTPGEIALSILAEVLLVRSQGQLAHRRLPPRADADAKKDKRAIRAIGD